MTTTQQHPEIKTIANLESAFAGESMAHLKYRYFAELVHEEVIHAFGHLDLLFPKATMTPARALQIAIDGETYEYTEIYPGFRNTAELEGTAAAVAEMDGQIEEGKLHAARFEAALAGAALLPATLDKAQNASPRCLKWKCGTPATTQHNWRR